MKRISSTSAAFVLPCVTRVVPLQCARCTAATPVSSFCAAGKSLRESPFLAERSFTGRCHRSTPFTVRQPSQASRAATYAAATARETHVTCASCLSGGMMAAAGEGVVGQLGSPSTQIGRPKTSIKKDVGRVTQQPSEPEADTERGSAKARPRRKTQEDEVPMFKVILLGDEEYVEAHVVTQLQKTVQIQKGEASRIFAEAQSTGSSIICVVCEEHAEFYAQQLRRQDIFVVVEKDE